MEEFLRNNYSILITSIEILAVFVGLIFYKKHKYSDAKYFIFILVYLFIIEFLGAYTIYVEKFEFLHNVKVALKDTLFEKNRWWFTLFWNIGGVLIFALYYQKVLKNKFYANLLKASTVIFLVFSFYIILSNWKDFFVKSFSSIDIAGALIIIQCAFYYFLEILSNERVLKFYKDLNFYISIAILIFWLIISPLAFYEVYYSTADWNYIILKWQVYLFANLFLYGMFAIGLIISNPEK
ncbi:MAG: hypothetical protein CMP05_07570 [Xanthomarina sp.]|mgnify:FL=1|uniref:hypothetical protein n=1 Tax=Xanthomarina sp. TaxID=1931211 RepID=UPI000C6BBCC5|nr:hypothetical protein [Xanthomarina sp.]MAL23490.1 hypothetical protein [Xanthomarina sp.]MBF61844.1 hypothetical protein [Xanthomarina sp.]